MVEEEEQTIGCVRKKEKIGEWVIFDLDGAVPRGVLERLLALRPTTFPWVNILVAPVWL
jgi:hypothetical protein